MRHLFRQRLRKQCIVTLKDEQAFSGVLFDVDNELLILRDATSVGEQGGLVAVDGEVLLPRAEVLFIQLPGTT